MEVKNNKKISAKYNKQTKNKKNNILSIKGFKK